MYGAAPFRASGRAVVERDGSRCPWAQRGQEIGTVALSGSRRRSNTPGQPRPPEGLRGSASDQSVPITRAATIVTAWSVDAGALHRASRVPCTIRNTPGRGVDATTTGGTDPLARATPTQVHPGMPPYTDTSGRGAVRIGKNCMPLTGTLRRKLIAETGESDLTAEPVDAPIPGLISAAALDKLREAAAHERAPADLLQLGDEDLLDAVGGIRRGRLTRAGFVPSRCSVEIRPGV